MPEVSHLIAGPERSMVITPQGTFAWGNIKTVLALPEGVDGAAVCRNDGSEVGHNRFAQEVPQRMSPVGSDWSGVADTVGMLVAWADGRLYQFAPELVWGRGAILQPLDTGVVRFNHVWGGDQAAYARDADGYLYAWGDGSYGRLGQGNVADSSMPRRISALRDVRALSAGMGHVLALDGQGRVWSWGTNAAGQLGHGDLNTRLAPQRVPFADKVVAIAAGGTHSLALDARGRLWGWGANQAGQLSARWSKPYASAPTRIETAHKIASLAAGVHLSLGVTADGQVLAWGWNGLGQLGQGDEAEHPGMKLVPLPGKVRTLSAGRTHVLAMTTDGACWSWGDNRHGACQGGADKQRVQSVPHRLALHAIDADEKEGAAA